jgi:hypothetical protein
MGQLAYWFFENPKRPLTDTPHEVLAALNAQLDGNFAIGHENNQWVVSSWGRPKFFRETEAEASEILSYDPKQYSVSFEKEMWFATSGDQFVFSAPTQEEVESFFVGMLTALHFREQGNRGYT